MIYKDNKDITSIFKDNKAITSVYNGDRLVWQVSKSCYGSGIWRESKPWLEDDDWHYKSWHTEGSIDIDDQWRGEFVNDIEGSFKADLGAKLGFLYRTRPTSSDCGYLCGFTDEDQCNRWLNGDTSVTPLFKVGLLYNNL